MSKTISDEMIYKLEVMSGLELTEEEKKKIKIDMVNMIEYLQILNEVDTSKVNLYEDKTMCNKELENIYREDVVLDDENDLLDKLPYKECKYIVVPKTI